MVLNRPLLTAILIGFFTLPPCAAEETDLIDRLLRKDAPNRDWRAYLHDRIDRGVAFPEWPPVQATDEEASTDAPLELWKNNPEALKKAASALKVVDESVTNTELLQQLEKIDWPATENILLKLAAVESAPAIQIFALGKLVARFHQDELKQELLTSWRAQLKQLVTDPDIPARTRHQAVDPLFFGKWSGQEDWVHTLLADEFYFTSFQRWQYDSTVEGNIVRDPDHWIPFLSKRVGHKNRTIHNHAVQCLSQFHLENARTDALRPLLPWLSDPKWAKTHSYIERLRLIQSLDRVDLPESVPGLIWVVENREGVEVAAAAESLLKYQEKSALPALRTAATKLTGSSYRNDVVRVIHHLGGYSDDDILTGLRSGVMLLQHEEVAGRLLIHHSDSTNELDNRGIFYLTAKKFPIRLVGQVLEMATELEQKKPLAGLALRSLAASVICQSSDHEFTRRLNDGDLELYWVLQILKQNSHYGKVAKNLDKLKGKSLGLQAALLKSPELVSSVLASDDHDARMMLLACARLLRLEIGAHEIAPIFEGGKSKRMQGIALSYLADIDTTESRKLLVKLGPDFVKSPFEVFGDWTNFLARNFGKEDEIIALLSSGGWGNMGQRFLIHKGGKTTYIHDEGYGRFRQREISAKELSDLRGFLDQYAIDDLPPYTPDVYDGIQFTYLRLNDQGVREVFMNNPPFGKNQFPRVEVYSEDEEPLDNIYGITVAQFLRLEEAKPLSVHYHSEQRIPGFKILHERENGRVHTISGEDGPIKVEISSEIRGKGPTWRTWNKDRLSADSVAAPSHYPIDKEGIFPKDEFIVGTHLLNNPWRVRTTKGTVYPGRRDADGQNGLWLFTKKADPELLISGSFANPVVSADGEWIVAARTDEGRSWAPPNSIYRVKVATGEIHRVEIPAADDLQAITFVKPHGKVLLRRQPENKRSHYFLLNAKTGEVEPVDGEFEPLEDETWRPLQATGDDNEFWACLHKTTGTQIGRYNSKTFKFSQQQTIEGLGIDSLSMWVSEDEGFVYAITEGDLIRFQSKK